MRVLERIQALVGRPRGSAETVSAPRGRSAGVRNEIGWGGAKVFGGIVLDEYNPDLKGRLALQVADKMRRTTGQIRAPRSSGVADREAHVERPIGRSPRQYQHPREDADPRGV